MIWLARVVSLVIPNPAERILVRRPNDRTRTGDNQGYSPEPS
jgi:hypothetical protein